MKNSFIFSIPGSVSVKVKDKTLSIPCEQIFWVYVVNTIDEARRMVDSSNVTSLGAFDYVSNSNRYAVVLKTGSVQDFIDWIKRNKKKRSSSLPNFACGSNALDDYSEYKSEGWYNNEYLDDWDCTQSTRRTRVPYDVDYDDETSMTDHFMNQEITEKAFGFRPFEGYEEEVVSEDNDLDEAI